MKVSLLSLFAVSLLPEPMAAQPGYIRQAARQEPARVQYVQDVQHSQNARVEAEYRFPLTLSMTTTGYQNGQKRENSVMVFYINSARGWVATPASSESKTKSGAPCAGLTVYDLKSNTMLVLNTREKRGLAMHLAAFAAKQAEERRMRNLPPAGDNGCLCARTGKKKVIEGFHAEEYSCKNPSRATRYDMWVTRDLKTDLAPPGSRLELNGFLHSAGRLGGVPLEGYYYENGDMKSSLLITDVNRATQFFVNTAEYKLNQQR
jgi:hypothetical protein